MRLRCPSCHRPLTANEVTCPECGAVAPSLTDLPEAVTLPVLGDENPDRDDMPQPHGTQAMEGIELPPASFRAGVAPGDRAGPRTPASPRAGASPGSPVPAYVADSRMGIADHFDPLVAGALFADRFRIMERLGGGGMGEVYRAHDLQLDQSVALKVLREELAVDPQAMAIFVREVRAARQISHPGVCRVFDLGRAEVGGRSRQFVSMELVDGESLDRLLRRIGRLPEPKAIQIARELCAGLAAIHDRGVLHRDLKPANIMIDGRGHARITDFGLAVDQRTRSGDIKAAGTPGYIAPEVLDSQAPTPASDVYSLGLVLYELFTGAVAYPAGSVSGMLSAQSRDDPPRPSVVEPSINPDIERVIMACLDRRPDRRPSSALMVAAMLPGGDPLKAALAAGLTPSPDTVAAASRRGALSVLSALGVLALIAVSIGISVWLGSRLSIVSAVADVKPPSVMIDKARSVLTAIGAPGRSAGSTGYLAIDEGAMAEARQTDASSVDFAGAICFVYREGQGTFATYGPRGVVLWDDPPESTPGVSSVRLDSAGRVREVRVSPLPGAMSESSSTDVDVALAPLFAAAEVAAKDLTSITSQNRPPMYADRVLAWESLPGTASEPLRVEAALLDSRPVWFHVYDPSRTPWRHSGPISMPNELNAGDLVAAVLQIGSVVFGLGLAIWNIRKRRGDVRGAVRFGALLGGCAFLQSLLSIDTPPREGALVAVFFSFAAGLMNGCITFLLYLALEPFARRMWPETLISWARLTQGRWSDPLVGRDLVLGTAAGVSCAALFCLALFVPHWSVGAPLPPPNTDDTELRSWSGVLPMIANMVAGVNASVVVTALTLIALILFKLVLRRRDLAAIVLATVQASTWGLAADVHPIGWIFILTMGGVMIATLTSVGLLAAATAIFVGYSIMQTPLTTDLGAWYAPWMMASIVITMLLALVGAAVAVRGGLVPVYGRS